MYVGFHEVTQDEKHRISVPASVRSQLAGDADTVRFYLAPGERENTLELFAEDYFPTFVENMHERLGLSDDAKDFETFFLSVSALIELDKQGRVVLPQQQLQAAGIGKQIVLLAAKDRLIMLNREAGQKFIENGWSTYRKMRELAELKNRVNHSSGHNGQSQ